jgi:stage V sporulation protein SpoVS
VPTVPAETKAKPSDACVLRVGGGTDVKRLAAAVVGVIEREKRQPLLEFIGAGACAQAVKSIAIANTFLARSGQHISVIPIFVHRDLADNHDTTGMQLKVVLHKSY